MDVWSRVADYALILNPVCTVKPGALMACASRTHRAAVEMAVHRTEFPACRRPLEIEVYTKPLRFCMHCPRQFEVPTVSFRPDLFQVAAPCLQLKYWENKTVRHTHCIAFTTKGQCVGCGVQFSKKFYEEVRSVVLFMHNKECGGCMTEIPHMCAHCCKFFAY